MSAPPRTYWHLAGLAPPPSDYEIASSRLLYHPQLGFSVQTPVTRWHERYVAGSALTLPDWEILRDPQEATYSAYIARQQGREADLEARLAGLQASLEGPAPSPPRSGLLDRVLAPLRFPVHGLSMVAAYLGQLAPSGRLTILLLFQAADEARRIDRLAQRVAGPPELAASSRRCWEQDPAWQPWRRVIEQLLVTHDWGEALVALTRVVKPLFDQLFVEALGEIAALEGDQATGAVLASLGADCAGHRAWGERLYRLLLEGRPENGAVISAWERRWQERCEPARGSFAELFAAGPAQVLARELAGRIRGGGGAGGPA